MRGRRVLKDISRSLALLCLLSSSFSCHAAAGTEEPSNTALAPLVGHARVLQFSMDVPPGHELTGREMADFYLFRLVEQRTRKEKCGLYIGNFPRFHPSAWRSPPEVTAGPGWQKKEFRSATGIEGAITFSDLPFESIPHSIPSPPSLIIHYWASDLGERDLLLVRSFIESIQVTQPQPLD